MPPSDVLNYGGLSCAARWGRFFGHSQIQNRPLTHNATKRNMIARRRWYFRGRVLKSRQSQLAVPVPHPHDPNWDSLRNGYGSGAVSFGPPLSHRS